MQKKEVVTKVLAWAGTALVWSPIVLTVGSSAAGSMLSGKFRLDWLMPAELFPLTVSGALLLLCVSIRAALHRRLVGWGLAAAVGFLAIAQVLAAATGLASGAIQPAGWPWVLCTAFIFLYTCALVVLGIGGILILRTLSARQTD